MQLDHLRERMRRLERSAPQRRVLQMLPVLRELVQLRAGGVYEVDPAEGGASLAWGLLAGPSAAGEWSAVIGVPEFGVEAATALGVCLERTVCVPDPGEAWLEVTAALIDVATLIVVRPSGRVRESAAAKIVARLRAREAAMISLGPWPRAETRLRATRPRWEGAGRGEGHLQARRLCVEVTRGAAPGRRVDLWFPAADLTLSAAPEQAPGAIGALGDAGSAGLVSRLDDQLDGVGRVGRAAS